MEARIHVVANSGVHSKRTDFVEFRSII